MGDSDDDFFGDMGAVMAACEQAERILEPNKVFYPPSLLLPIPFVDPTPP